MSLENSIQTMIDLGFTRMESEIYTFLLSESPATGYRISQAIGKAVANTYKALQTLENKGAIIIDDSNKRQCRAVPVDELLSRLERQFLRKKGEAQNNLSHIGKNVNDDRVYQLKSPEQVLERCRQMLRKSKQIVVIDAFPNILNLLKDDINDTIKRKVRVAVNSYTPLELDGIEIFERIDGEQIIQRWPGEWINIVIDGTEHLIAIFDKELKNILQAIWSSSPYLSWVYYSALMSELQLNSIKKILTQNITMEELRNKLVYFDSVFPLDAPGYQKLMERFKQTV